jgi:hypothetical protein
MLEVMKASSKGHAADLAAELNEHLDACPYCASMLPQWVAGCVGMKVLREQTDLMEKGALRDSTVLRRDVREGTTYFQPAADQNGLGLMVIVSGRSPYDARRVARITRAKFEELK